MLVTPPHWNAASESLAQVGRGSSLLMLDYDGTLAPFHEDRMQALPWPGIAERLDRLATMPSVHLAVVTGRSARELSSLLSLRHAVEIWGSHGREHLTSDGVYTSSSPAPAQQAVFDQVEMRLQQMGLGEQVERKVASIAAHWRGLPVAVAEKLEQIVRDVYRVSGERAGLQLL